MRYDDLIHECKDVVQKADEFDKIRIYSVLKTIGKVVPGEKQDITPILTGELPQKIADSILHLYLNILSDHAPEAYEKLDDGGHNFDYQKLVYFIGEHSHERENPVHLSFSSSVEHTCDDIFQGQNAFKDFLNSPDYVCFRTNNKLDNYEAAYFLAKVLDKNKNLLLCGNHGHDLATISVLAEIPAEELFPLFENIDSFLERQDLFQEEGKVNNFLVSNLFEKNYSDLDPINFNEALPDEVSFSDLYRENKEQLDLAAKLLKNKGNNPFITIWSTDNSDLKRERIGNVSAFIASKLGMKLFTISRSADLTSELMESINLLNGILFVEHENFLSSIFMVDYSCPVISCLNPYEAETSSHKDDDFDPEEEVSSLCQKPVKLNEYGKSSSFIVDLKIPAKKTYIQNCKKFFMNNGFSLKKAEKMAQLFSDHKVKPEIWKHITEIIKQQENLSEKELLLILDSMNPGDRKNQVQKSPHYSPDVINTDVDLKEIVKEIKNSEKWKKLEPGEDFSYKALFYGISGGGKSAGVKYIAREMEKNLMVIHPSDYQRSKVGESERIIKKIFEKAAETDSILLFDECDSLIYSRESVGMSWERSQINEFIQQIESFSGILFATTNLRKVLDSAMDRRFTTQVKFSPMKKEGIRILCDKYFGSFGLTEKDVDEIYMAGEVCPGDFNVVKSRIRLMDPEVVTTGLIRNLMIKTVKEKNQKDSSRIGFGK